MSSTRNASPRDVSWPSTWRAVPLWSIFERVKDLGHPNEHLLSVYREHGVVKREERDDNFNKAALDRSIYQLVHPGWLVVNRMKAWQGSVGISPYRGVVSGHYICFRPTHQEDSRFLNWLLRSDVYTAEYSALSRGVRPNQVEIDNDWLRVLPIVLPGREEQYRIARFLELEVGRIDRLFRLRKRQVSILNERYSSYISEIATPGISSGSERSELWPWLPASTNTVRLGYLARIQSGVTVHEARESGRDDAEYPYLRVANVQGEEISLSEVKTIRVPKSMAGRSMLQYGDVVMTEANGNPDNLGRGAVWRDEIPDMIHQNHVFAIRVDVRKLLPEYLSILLASVHGRRYFRFTSTQVGIATTSGSKVRDFPVPELPIWEQKSVIAEYERARRANQRAVSALTRQLSLLDERRNSLITAAVTGQFDVSTASGRNVTEAIRQ